MDVHPVHHAPRTWRDFFLQLLMITIGLFIALSPQTGVESLHHRHLVRDARENLREEIQNNLKRSAENIQFLEKNRQQVARSIDLLKELGGGKTIDKTLLAWGMNWNGYIDASWKTARDTGAVSYMSSEFPMPITK
ncbi:MAG TPA: hypothetical protein VHW71_16480 [Steroidobacteraceae bacterium]|nr:hypothetical protein [Steroidobacteraceae bacterium]